MKKKLSLWLAVTLSASLLLSACGGGGGGSSDDPDSGSGNAPTAENPATIIWGNYGSSAMPPYFADVDAIEYIEEKSGGALKYQYSPDGVLGGEADMIQQVMDGTIQAVTVSTSTFNPYTTLTEVFQLPFLIGDYETEYKALTSDAAQAIFDKVGEDLGVKIVAVQENGMRHFANNVRPITCLEDMKGLKLRIVSSNMLTEVMTNLGANPQSVAYNDVYSALQNKVVDGEEINLTSIYAMKHYEVLDYVSLIGMYPFPGVVVYNLDFWNSLSPEQQQIITEGHQLGTENLFNTYLPEYEEEAYAAIEEASTQINEVSEEERERFVEVAQSTWDEYYNKDPLIADFIDYVKSISE